MYFNKLQMEVVNNYLNKSLFQKLLYVGRGLEIAEAFKEYFNASHNDKSSKYSKLCNFLWKKDTKHIKEIFEGKEYGALKLILGEPQANDFRNIWNRTTRYTYSIGYYRRSYRTNISSHLYMNKNIEKLKEFVYLSAKDFSMDKYFRDNKTDYQDITVIADIIALELDENNAEVMEKIKGVVYSENNTVIITREIIKGSLMSKNEEAHRLIGELLLAAKLQEGLRQAIVECVDEASREGFIYIIKLIIDNNLMRFSSVARAFGTWTGLPLDIERPKVVAKCFEAAFKALSDKEYQSQCIASQDNLLIYIGTWAAAFDELEDIEGILKSLLTSEEKYKRLVALQFLHDTQFNIYKHKTACSVLKDNELEVAALAVKNLFGDLNPYSLRYNEDSLKDFCKLEHCYGTELFKKLDSILQRMPRKEVEFKGSVFPWVDFKVTTAEVMEKMLLAVVKDYNSEIVDSLIDLKEKMNADTRGMLIELFLKNPENTKQKQALLEACGDRSEAVRKSAFKIVDSLELTEEDYSLVENLLQYKSGDLRKSAIKLLMKQPGERLNSSVNRLMECSNENKRLAAIDIVRAMEGNEQLKSTYSKCLGAIVSMNLVTQKEELLTKNISKDKQEVKNFENGFGLYDKLKEYEAPAIKKLEDFNIVSRLSITEEKLNDILNKFGSVIHEFRDLEYEVVNWDGTKTTITLGGSNYLTPFTREGRGLNNYPIADKIREVAHLNNLSSWTLIELDFSISVMDHIRYYPYEAWYEAFLEENMNFKMLKKLCKSVDKISYYNKIKTYIRQMVIELPKDEVFEVGKTMSEYLYTIIPAEKHVEEYISKKNNYYLSRKNLIAGSHEVTYWLNLMRDNIEDNENFIKYFATAYTYYKASKYNVNATLELGYFGHAQEIEIIDENEVYKELLERPLSSDNILSITNIHRHDRNNLGKYTRLIELGNKAVDIIANIEVKRGELNTEVSHLAAKIQKCYGVSIFSSIILASEKDTYIRGYNFTNGDSTKKQMLSHLLKCCYPKEGDSAKTLEESLKGKKITSKQLIEAAMYSPQWLDIVSEYLGYPGLKSACWYFHAHVNDVFSNEKAAIVARYTPICVEELKDGAFDQQWFIEAYNTLGDKNFKLVYDSAKYIAGGGLHKRSQLFADATLGKLDILDVKARIMDKRNKDYLLTFGLIPVKSKEDLLERYEYIHQYIKESKQFGAQRQASEGRSAAIALLNLARNAGYSDVNRLTWNMETARVHAIKEYLEPKTIEDIEIQLVIDELGQAEISCCKAGKELKTLPAKLKNNEYIAKLKELKKSLKDQYVRAKQSFETAMENGECFKAEELINLSENPVLSPIINNLVFKAGDKFGYLQGDMLIDFMDEACKLQKDTDVIIAHPVHLYESNCWSDYQKDIFKKTLIQPFRQVFRELYSPNADELKELTLSRRYAGHQVQPKKTAALLKTRGWVLNNEEGLQKIYYKENIIATIYAIADWFSPADIEAPTIEFVRFEDRKTYKPVPIDNVSKLIFSEVMRDVDLVVSVAHVGGVDPEASLSTVEIRTVIVEEILKLMKLSNVKLKGSHAYIKGVHGEYTVHLGSGVTHKMGVGAINILPVHSSHRGRIFLPFIDSDPKSAEIISKIVLLSEDNKIKDPSVLEQIVR